MSDQTLKTKKEIRDSWATTLEQHRGKVSPGRLQFLEREVARLNEEIKEMEANQ